MTDNPKKFKKKTIVAIFFIVLFTLSIALVFFYPSPVSENNEGYVNVSRSEGYWQNTLGNTTESRYLINYGIFVVSDAPKVTITDKAEAHLTQIDIEQDTSNVKVSYDETTGAITVIATDIDAQDKVFAQLAFKMDAFDIFVPNEKPTTTITPTNIYWGDKTQVNIKISPFNVARSANITEIGVYAWFTEVIAEISNVTTNPTAVCDPPQYQAIWQYSYPEVKSYGAHTANYTIRLPTTTSSGNILLRTWVEVRYSTALRMNIEGKITGADGYFFKTDSAISYQYEHKVLTR